MSINKPIFRCPSCRTQITAQLPTMCPKCNLGIPEEKGAIYRDPRTPRGGFTGKEVMDRNGMPLDAYVDRMKKSGYS